MWCACWGEFVGGDVLLCLVLCRDEVFFLQRKGSNFLLTEGCIVTQVF